MDINSKYIKNLNPAQPQIQIRLSLSTQRLISQVNPKLFTTRNSPESSQNSLKFLKLAPIKSQESKTDESKKIELKTPEKETQAKLLAILTPKRRVSRCAYLSQKGQLNGFDKLHNQDEVLFLPQPNQIPHQFLFGIFDGHGDSGHLISSFLKTQIKSVIISLSHSTTSSELESFMKYSINLAVTSLDLTKIDVKDSGSTLCMIIISGSTAVCGNVGDSRCVVGVRKDEWVAEPLSKDHKPDDATEAKRIKKMGGKVTDSYFKGVDEQALRVTLANSDEGALAMTRSIGDKRFKKIGVIDEAEYMARTLKNEDRFIIIASDGLWDMISNKEAVDIVAKVIEKNHAKSACEALVTEARTRWRSKGELIDDISVVVVLLNSDN